MVVCNILLLFHSTQEADKKARSLQHATKQSYNEQKVQRDLTRESMETVSVDTALPWVRSNTSLDGGQLHTTGTVKQQNNNRQQRMHSIGM